MSDKGHMDNLVKEKLEGFSVAPPSHVWSNIQDQLADRRRKRRVLLMVWVSTAAVVVLAFIAGWYFNENNKSTKTKFVQEVSDQPVKKNQEIEQQEQTIFVDELISESVNDQLVSTTNTISETYQEKFVDSKRGKRVAGNFSNNEQVESIKKFNYSLLQKIEAVLVFAVPEIELEHCLPNSDINELNNTDKLLIASNIENIGKSKQQEKGWIVGAYLSPGYSSHSVSHNESYAQNMTYSSNDGNGNVGGGFSVQYKTSKRLRVESGLYYSKDGQKSNNSLSLLTSKDMESSASPESDNYSSGQYFANTVQASSNGIEMNSTAGVINMSSTPQGAEIVSDAEESYSRSENTLYSDGEFSQVFEFVEVPLYVRYSLLNKRFGIELLAGVNAGFVIGNNAYLDNQYGLQNIGSTSDISTLNFSGTMGVGFNYSIGKNLSIALEPRLNYYLSSINTNPDVDYRPYRIGIFTGLSYEF